MSTVDVLVVGAGAAGLMAALSAAQSGASVRVISKGRPNTVEIVGFNVPIGDPADSPQRFFEDTMVAGEFGGHPGLVAHMVHGIGPVFRKLEALGLDYRMADGTYSVRLAADNHYPRTLYHQDQTGPRLLQFLRQQVKAAGVELVDESAALQLLRDQDGAASGVLCWDRRRESVSHHFAKAVVLAAGGLGQLYSFNTNSPGITGDGYAMAYLAGAEVIDMEYVQFEPFIMVDPPASRGYAIPTTIVTNEGALVTDRFGREVLPRNREGNLRGVTKWAMSRAMYLRIQEGAGTDHGGLWFDCRHVSPEVLAGYPRFLNACKQAGLDPLHQVLEVAPAGHNCMGGLRIDRAAATGIPGLFACGEVAGGLHGGNRMAGNSGPDCLVFGDTAGTSAAAWAARRTHPSQSPDVALPDLPTTGPDAGAIRERVGHLMWRYVGVARTDEGLRLAVAELQDLVHQAWIAATPDPLAAAELRHLTLTGLMVASTALLRRESRGAHFRLDYPTRDDERFLGTIGLTMGREPWNVQARWIPLTSSLSHQSNPYEEETPWFTAT